MKNIVYTVEKKEDGMLLREFLTRRGLSKTLIKKTKPGGLSVEGEIVTVRRVLKAGDEVNVRLPEASSEKIKAIDIPMRVVYEDEYLLVVDKPTNMPTHPSRGNSLPTLANAVMSMQGESFVFRAVNRLDRDTSGLVLIAKDAHTANKLSQSMKKHEFSKKYLALIDGIPQKKQDTICAPIRRESEGSIKRIVADDGKPAITEYNVLYSTDGKSMVEVILHTGRTHQIRVHMAHIGHPLTNDFLYGTRADESYFLRCYELSFPHPTTSEIITICAENADFVN